MPYVFVKRGTKVPDDVLALLALHIPLIVAQNLNIASRPLSSAHVDVFFSDFSRWDKTSADLQVIIQAHKYPERAALNCDDIAAAIHKHLDAYVDPLKFSSAVWLQLIDGGYSGSD